MAIPFVLLTTGQEFHISIAQIVGGSFGGVSIVAICLVIILSIGIILIKYRQNKSTPPVVDLGLNNLTYEGKN